MSEAELFSPKLADVLANDFERLGPFGSALLGEIEDKLDRHLAPGGNPVSGQG